MKTSSKKWQKIRKIKGLRQFVTWYPRHVSENPGRKSSHEQNVDLQKSLKELLPAGAEYLFMENKIDKKYNRNQGNNSSIMSLEDEQYKLLEEWIKNDN